MHMNSLPSLVFRLIFSRLSLHDQLQVGRVCWLWKDYQRDITNKIRSITLLIGVENYDHSEPPIFNYRKPLHENYRSPSDLIAQSPFTLHHCSELVNDQADGPLFAVQPKSALLNLPYLHSSTLNELVDSLPNVHTLNISINGIHSYVIDQVIRLLNKWKDQLVTFKLWCNFSYSNWEVDRDWYNHFPKSNSTLQNVLVKLFETLNCLSILDHLTFEFNHYFYPYKNSHISDFTVLSRLSEFNFRSLDMFMDLPMYEWLKQCDVNCTQLQRIGLDFEDDYNFFLYVSLPLPSKMIVLPQVHFVEDDVEENVFLFKEQIRLYLNACSSLTSLRFALFDDLVELINMLTPFKELIHLKLYFKYYDEELFEHFDRTPSHKIAQLFSVKLLTLKCEMHSDLNSRNWGWAFPNVQILQLEHNCFQPSDDRCYDPYEFKGKRTKKVLDQLVIDVRDWLDTFKQMPRLRRIYLNDYEREYKGQYDLIKFNFTL